MKVQELFGKETDRLLLDVSLWSGNLLDLDESIRKTERMADCYHLDVADAHFVHGLLFFPDLVAAIRKRTSIPLHSHLMMDDPYGHLDDFIDAGSDIITVHLELGEKKLKPIISYLKGKGVKVGLAVCVETDVHDVVPYLSDIDLVLMMGTRIGIKGVSMEPDTPDRIRALKDLIGNCGKQVLVSADGGIRTNTVPLLRSAGVDMITPGSLVFKSEDLDKTVQWTRTL